MNNDKYGLDAKKVRTEGNKGKKSNAGAPKCKAAKRTTTDKHEFARSSHSQHR